MPNLAGMIDDGRYGSLAASRRPEALAQALADEVAAWDAGRRQAQAIAAHWRARLSPVAVSRGLLGTLSV